MGIRFALVIIDIVFINQKFPSNCLNIISVCWFRLLQIGEIDSNRKQQQTKTNSISKQSQSENDDDVAIAAAASAADDDDFIIVIVIFMLHELLTILLKLQAKISIVFPLLRCNVPFLALCCMPLVVCNAVRRWNVSSWT